MKKWLLILPLLVMNPAFSQAVATTPQEAYLTQTIRDFMKQKQVQGVAVELIVKGKVHEYYFGYADDAKTSPVVPKTIFEIGSLGKVMTSLLMAQEVDWAKMQFTDPITRYVKDLPKSYDTIRLQDLATHTAGLSLEPTQSLQTPADLTHYLAEKTPKIKTGQQWRYSNLDVNLLSLALANSTESEFGDLYRRHILNPLQMVNGVTIPSAYEKYYAQGHDINGNPVPRQAANPVASAYELKASAIDMQHFLSAAIGLKGTPPRVFYPMRMTQSIYVKVGNDYQGLGWMIHSLDKNQSRRLYNAEDRRNSRSLAIQENYARALYKGNTLIDNTGTTSGFSVYIGVLPDKQSGIVVLANKHVNDKDLTQLTRKILFHVVEIPGIS